MSARRMARAGMSTPVERRSGHDGELRAGSVRARLVQHHRDRAATTHEPSASWHRAQAALIAAGGPVTFNGWRVPGLDPAGVYLLTGDDTISRHDDTGR